MQLSVVTSRILLGGYYCSTRRSESQLQVPQDVLTEQCGSQQRLTSDSHRLGLRWKPGTDGSHGLDGNSYYNRRTASQAVFDAAIRLPSVVNILRIATSSWTISKSQTLFRPRVRPSSVSDLAAKRRRAAWAKSGRCQHRREAHTPNDIGGEGFGELLSPGLQQATHFAWP
jgi:hypothetical protein